MWGHFNKYKNHRSITLLWAVWLFCWRICGTKRGQIGKYFGIFLYFPKAVPSLVYLKLTTPKAQALILTCRKGGEKSSLHTLISQILPD